MKNNLENSFKESLQDFEMPYNPSAWEAMSSKLDAKLPTTTAPKSNIKWYAIASTVLIASVGAYFFFTHNSQNNEQTEERIVQNENTLSGNENVETTSTSDTQINVTTTDENVEGSIDNIEDHNNQSTTNQGGTTSNTQNSGSTSASNTNGSSSTGATNTGQSGNNSQSGNVTTQNETVKPFKVPAIADLCNGESLSIKNDNKNKLFIISPAGNSFHVKPLASNTFVASESGVHAVGYYGKDGFVQKRTFTVLNKPFIDFTINDDRKYENGVPVTQVETSVPGSDFHWNFGKTTSTGRKAEAHFFKKGNHDITLTVTGANGCTSTSTETIYVEHEHGDKGNYNLLAPQGIILNSLDAKNRTFMPNGLKERDVAFKMVIYAMNDGHVVFESSDVSNPWTGVDKSTGRQVASGTTFYWEIIISNPMPGESSKYKGALTVLNN